MVWGRTLVLGRLSIPAVVTTLFVVVSGAQAVAETHTGLDRFHEQPLTWEPCPETLLEGLECADVQVPLDYAAPEGRTITVAVSRARASGEQSSRAQASGERRGTLFVNPGGPGISARHMPLPENPQGIGGLGDQRIAQVYDLIAMDPRGTGGSSPRIACEEHAAPPLPRPDEAEYEQLTDLAREGERDCQERFGNLRPHVSTANTARDMDVVRAVLGEDSLSYLGFSYGTTLGAVYGTLFPERLDRAVLDSAMPPEGTHREQYTQMAPAHTANVDRFTVWLAEHDDVYGLGEDAEEVHGLLLEVSDRLAADPREDVPGWGPLDGHGFDAIMGDHARYQQNWDVAADFVWRLANDEPFPENGTPRMDPIAELNPYTHGVLMTVMCETPWPTDPEVYRSETAEFAQAHPFGPGTFWTVPQWCTFAGWEPAEPPVEIDGEAFDDALVVQAEFDAQTPYEGGEALAEHLGAAMVTVTDDGGHGLYGAAGYSCATEAVDAYLVDGHAPEDVSCAGPAIPEPIPPLP